MQHGDLKTCVYILKTGKNLFKIGKTRDLQRRLSSYHTHLPILFRVVRQYPAANMSELEESLHIVFQHRRIKGEWFQLTNDDLVICDNIARNYALAKLQRQVAVHQDNRAQRRLRTSSEQCSGRSSESHRSSDPLLQVMEANEKYLRDYSRIADDVRLGLSIQEIVELHEGSVSKVTVQTVRRLLKYQTPNSEFLHQWFFIVGELEAGTSDARILEKYPGQLTRATILMIRRIMRNQLY
jgi:uncharacterized protein (DUF433 family)